jgi:TetR/AcrR family transcriptional regulator, transcriptional repressor for nem operon
MFHPMKNAAASTRERILTASLKVMREKGYSATTVDDLCSAAQVTKGAFFHHFQSKEDLGVAATDYWTACTSSLFDAAPYHSLKDPLEKLMAYLDLRIALIQGKIPEFTCFAGTLVQETFHSHSALRVACERSIFGHIDHVSKLIREAKRTLNPNAKWNPKSLAAHTQAVIQGAFILVKSSGDSSLATESIEHLKTYVHSLLSPPTLRKRRIHGP